MKQAINTKTLCYQCSEECDEQITFFDQKAFCCEGCKLVYELLSENNLCDYYNLDDKPGISRKDTHQQYR